MKLFFSLLLLIVNTAFSQNSSPIGYRPKWMSPIKPISKPMAESTLGLRQQVLGFNSSPEVWSLGDNALIINGQEYNTIRITSDSKAILGKIVGTKGDLYLSEASSLKFKVSPGSSTGIKGRVVDLNGEILELYKDHVVIAGNKIETKAYATFDTEVVPEKPKLNDIAPKISKTKLITSGLMKAVSIASYAMMFMPQNNPFAQVVGHSCEDLKKAKNRIVCEYDSYLNPLNNVVNCSEILDYWIQSDPQNGCGSRYHFYSLRVDSEQGKNYLKDNDFFKKYGSAALQKLSLTDKKKMMKKKTEAKEFETAIMIFPQGDFL